MRKGLLMGVILLITVFTSGCATITTGRHQRVPVDSNPQGAEVTVSSGYRGLTPCSFELERSKDHVIKISLKGYKTAQVLLRKTLCGSTFGNIILGGVIGLGVDAMSGAMFKLIPENVYVDLVPGEEDQIVVIEAPRVNKEEPKKEAPEPTTNISK